MAEEQERHWQREYEQLHRTGPERLDYAADEEQLFTFGAAMLAAGAVTGLRCLDAGCGRGPLARGVHALGASQVVAFDMVEATMDALRLAAPEIDWAVGSLTDAAFVGTLGRFDRVFAVEVLQYVDSRRALATLWGAVASGGRLAGVVPNGDNAFVRRTADASGGFYAPPGARVLLDALADLPDVADAGLIGMAWREDRSTMLYDLLPLTRDPDWAEPPKRLVFVARKAG